MLFNGKQGLRNLKQRILNNFISGVENGLRLKLNVEQNEYMPGPHNSAGLKFLLHDGADIPMVHDLGQAVSIGSHVFIGVKLLEVHMNKKKNR